MSGFNWKMFFGALPKVLLIVAFVYVVAAVITYRFRHPEMTETELMLNTFEALLWR